MKRTLFILIAAIQICYAQEKDQAIATVHYIFKHINDSTQKDKFLRDEVATYIGKTSSYYTSNSGNRASESIKKQLDDPGFDGNIVINRNSTTIKESYIINPSAPSVSEIRTIAGDKYLVDSEVPEQEWDIEESTKDIGGYTCQKATTEFKGRKYTAWFTTELPFSYGPWKLHGLPGLILEVYDSKKEVVFEYDGFDKDMSDLPVVIEVPENALHVSIDEFTKQENAFKANPQAYMDARAGSGTTARKIDVAGGGTASVVVRGTSSGSPTASPSFDASKIKSINVKNADDYKPSSVTNNPIELIP